MSDKQKLGFTFYPQNWWDSDTFLDLPPELRYMFLEITFKLYVEGGSWKVTQMRLHKKFGVDVGEKGFDLLKELFQVDDAGLWSHKAINKRLSLDKRSVTSAQNGKSGGRPSAKSKNLKKTYSETYPKPNSKIGYSQPADNQQVTTYPKPKKTYPYQGEGEGEGEDKIETKLESGTLKSSDPSILVILNFFKAHTGKNICTEGPRSKSNRNLVKNILKSSLKPSVDECLGVIKMIHYEWEWDEKMKHQISIKVIFRPSNFIHYLDKFSMLAGDEKKKKEWGDNIKALKAKSTIKAPVKIASQEAQKYYDENGQYTG